jgi:DNA mismatch repair protein MutL
LGRIQILSDDLANKIAAGEVVERPASVVKELLENSLDAGASEFRIELEAGGRRLIRLVDNGSGMLRDDALLAFERHATSKLRETKDLMAISTLGFRGEALPSIASVSRLTLETRAQEEPTGSLVEFSGGRLVRCDEAALPRGTAVTVRDLFYNVPARKKFLRSEQTELAHIAQLVTHYSLAHAQKSFELRHGAQPLLDVSPVERLRERVFQIFGAATLEQLVELEPRETSFQLPPPWPPQPDLQPEFRYFQVSGFVSQPQFHKPNRNSTYLFVNRRFIKDRLLLHALSAAYASLMPGGVYPFAILFLDCDPEAVDVNVHPAKTEVRFHNSSFVHDFVRDSIREQLMLSRPASALPLRPVAPQPAANLPFSEFTQTLLTGDLPPALNPAEPRPVFTPLPQSEPRLSIPDTHGPLPDPQLWDASPNLSAIASLRILGQIHDSFIVAAGPDGLWIIDQHVAHERILFEQVTAARDAQRPESQRLLVPLLIDLTPGQVLQYERIATELTAYGFETSLLGPRTLAVQGAPSGLNNPGIERALFEIIDIPDRELRGFSLEETRRDICATIACRAAIKINTPLEPSKMEWLLQTLAQTHYPMSCPHGRPIALRYSMREILRGFHRI